MERTLDKGVNVFGFGKKKEKATQGQEANQWLPGEELVAPVSGNYKPLSAVSDPVFAQGMMGQGFAVEPQDGVIVAPATGELALLQDTLHAFMIRTPDRAEVLVHIGIDTVELGGRGFTALAQVGQQVVAGEPIVKVDWEAISADIPSSEVMVMATNSKAFSVAPHDDNPRPVTAGQAVATTLKK